MGKAHHAGHHLVAHLDLDLDARHAAAHHGPLAVAQAEALGVVRMHAQALAALAAHQVRDVVQPAVVRARVAPPDQPQRKLRDLRRVPL